MTATPAAVETEAKFDVLARGDARTMLAADSLAGLPALGPPRRVRQLDRYLDAPDGRLRSRGWAARVRSVGDSVRIQLKRMSPPDASGVQRRTELDGPAVPGDNPDLWPRSAARRRLLQLLAGAEAVETVTLQQTRLVREFGTDTGAVELSLDRTEVLVAGAVAGRLTVLELEHRGGDQGAFERAAAFLRTQPFLAPSFGTKLGWAADVTATRSRPDDLPVIGAEDALIQPNEPTPEAGRRILRAQLRRLLDRERAFRTTPGAEEIRRMRVATRRLRATWRVFGGAFAGATPDRLRRRLRRLAGTLSAVRDLDVLLARLEAHSAPVDTDGRDPVEGFRSAIIARRAAALETLHEELAGARHRRWLEAFADFVETPGRGVVPVGPPAPRLLREQIGGWIWSGFERLLAWEPLLPVADALTLHDLRLETKRLRDVVQVVAPVASAPTAPVVAGLVRLQDVLGGLNDATVAAAETRSYLRAKGSRLSPGEADAVGRFAITQEREAERFRRRVPSAWRTATSPASRRRVARLIGSF